MTTMYGMYGITKRVIQILQIRLYPFLVLFGIVVAYDITQVVLFHNFINIYDLHRVE